MKQQFDIETINRTKKIVKPAGWSTALFEVGVDSGQAGFFDDAVFAVHNGGYDEAFCDKAYDITLSNKKAGVMLNGVVSSSGYGDGGYECTYYFFLEIISAVHTAITMQITNVQN